MSITIPEEVTENPNVKHGFDPLIEKLSELDRYNDSALFANATKQLYVLTCVAQAIVWPTVSQHGWITSSVNEMLRTTEHSPHWSMSFDVARAPGSEDTATFQLALTKPNKYSVKITVVTDMTRPDKEVGVCAALFVHANGKVVIVFNSSDVYRVREPSTLRVPGFIPSVMKSHGITE